MTKTLFNATKACDCGNPKPVSQNFCAACWMAIPSDLRARLQSSSRLLFQVIAKCKESISRKK